MKIDHLMFYLDNSRDREGLHPYSHFLFGEQACAFSIWMTFLNEIKISLPKPISLRIEIVDPSKPPTLQNIHKSSYYLQLPFPYDRYASLPFEMVEGQMSKLFRAKGLTTEAELRPLFAAPDSNAIFFDILRQSLMSFDEVFQADIEAVEESFQRFVAQKYVSSWIWKRKRFPAFKGTAELEYNLDAYSMKKEIILRQKGVEKDRCLVTENGPSELQWAGTFNMKVEGNEIVMGFGTFRYEPFHGVRMVSLNP